MAGYGVAGLMAVPAAQSIIFSSYSKGVGSMITQGARVSLLFVLLVFLAMGATGCVSVDRYQAMEAEAAQAWQQLKEAQVAYAQEKLRTITLEKQNNALKAQTDKWEANLKDTITRLEGLADDWGQVRDDLIRLNMDSELKRMRTENPDAKGVILLEPTGRAVSQKRTAKAVEKAVTPETEEAELNRVLEQFRNLLKK